MANPVADEWVTVEDDAGEWTDLPAEKPPRDLIMGRYGDPNYPRKPRLEELGDFAKNLAVGAALGGAGRLLTKVPAGRLWTAGKAAAAGAMPDVPFIGKPVIAGARAAREAWRASAPKAAAVPPKVAAAAGPKPKLTAQQVKQAMREQYGSERGGRMLYGPARPGVTATQRQSLMKTGTQGGNLPKAAQRAMAKELAASTPEEAFAYAAKAPNAPAQQHLGDLLRQIILERSGR
jgi:hypothetical protein